MGSKSIKNNICAIVQAYLESQREAHPEGLPAEEIATVVGFTKKQVQGALYLMEKHGILKKMGQAKTVNGRVIIPHRYAVMTAEEQAEQRRPEVLRKQWKPQASMQDFLASLATTHHG